MLRFTLPLGLAALGCYAPVAKFTPTPVATAVALQPTETQTLPATATPTRAPSFTPLPSLTPQPSLTPTETATPEPAGCWKPPDDYTRVKIENASGSVLNQRTLAMLQHAATIYNGEIEITGGAITQGSYTSSEPASFGTHDGGGAVDFSVMRKGTFTVLWKDIELLIHALRVSGFAAWLRTYGELYANSPYHIHAIAIGDRDLSPAAKEQLTGKFGYFRGFTGVPVDGPPKPDRHGGPILCQWMLDMGYKDLR